MFDVFRMNANLMLECKGYLDGKIFLDFDNLQNRIDTIFKNC